MKNRLLSVSCFAALSSVVLGAASSAAPGLEDPPSLVAHFSNYGDSSILDIRLRGSARGIDYSIAAMRRDDDVVFDITLGTRSAQLRLPKEAVPDIDLRTIREGVNDESEPHTLRFGVEFGELGGCLANPETPRRLLIRFDVEGRISASSLSAEGCQLVWRQLNLIETGPAIYAATVDS